MRKQSAFCALSVTIVCSTTSAALVRPSLVPIPSADYEWLQNATALLVKGCLLTTPTGAMIFTPDASSSYGAQWTRDFTMALSNAPGALRASGANVSAAVAYTLDRITPSGQVPDRVQADGTPVFAPGGPGAWPIQLAWDNMPYAGLLLASYVREWNDTAFYCTYEPTVRRALAFVERHSAGTGGGTLAYNDPAHPNCSFGFEDSVVLPGHQLTVSLLLYDAASQLAQISADTACGNESFYHSIASSIASAVDTLSDTATPLFLASDVLETIPDVFGSAYAVTLGLSTSTRRAGISAYLATQWNASSSGNAATIFQDGQVRHLPQPLLWRQCWGGSCPAPGTYQNGAFWATPLNWVIPALAAGGFRDAASAVARSTVASFRNSGIWEAINRPIGYTGVRDYVASATNLLGVVTPG